MCNKSWFVLLLAVVPGVTCAQATLDGQPAPQGPQALEGQQAPAPQTPLEWAYALNTPGVAPLVLEGPQRVPGSEIEIVFSNPRDLYAPPDWHPADHPPMPDIVARGRNPGVFACGYCHLPNGQGRPENASLAGLPAEYIIQQIRDYRESRRISSEPQHGPANLMRALAQEMTASEVAEAALYFSALEPVSWIRVVETDTVPQTVVSGWMYIEKEGGGTEAIGARIIEMPEDLHRTELRDARSGFVAYVPPGSIARGKALAEGSDGRTPCSACHGADLQGLGPVPSISGRSPSYLARQLYDFQTRRRSGLWSPLMRDVVAGLTPEQIVDLTAYLASLEP
ncbi:MAG: c-type cytochrome [Gammaproteobacteria bacterium]